MTIQDIMNKLRPKCLAKWQERLGNLGRGKKNLTAEEAYKAGYWDGVVDGVDVGTDVGIINQTPCQDQILQ